MRNMTLLLSCRGIRKDFGDLNVLKDINLDIVIGERIGLVGRNGAGKTTLANIIFRSVKQDKGEVIWYKKDIKTGYLLQSTFYTSHIFNDMIAKGESEYSLKEFLKASSHLGMEKVKEWDIERFSGLSGGEKTKLALANIWSSKPGLLILDEPTNHLDLQGIQWLVEEMKKYNGTIIIISHDRYFLDKSVHRIIEIEEGVINNYKGNYSFYRDEKKRRYESQLHEYMVQEKYREKIAKEIKQLKNWSSKAHRESRKKAIDTGNKSGGKEHNRVKAKKKDKQIKSKLKRLEKIEAEGVKKPEEEAAVNFVFDSANKSSRIILEAQDISKKYGERVLFKDSSFYIKRKERVGIFGKNGCGKTTLLKAILRNGTVDSGKLFISPSAKAAYLSQDVLDLDGEKSVIDIFHTNTREKLSKTRILLANMGFDEGMIEKPIKFLSLGERTRVKIAQMILQENSILILDEPTNHLDLHSRERLEETLKAYEGTILLVSHDRYMMEKICNKMLIFKDNKIQRFECGFKEYLAKFYNKDSTEEDVQKMKKSKREEKLIIENKIAYLLGELSKYTEEDPEYKQLDLEFKALIKMKK